MSFGVLAGEIRMAGYVTWPWEANAARLGCIWSPDLLPPGAYASGAQTSSLIFSPYLNSLHFSLLQQHFFWTLQLDFDKFFLDSVWISLALDQGDVTSENKAPCFLTASSPQIREQEAQPGSVQRQWAECRGDTQLKITICLVSTELHPGMGFPARSN